MWFLDPRKLVLPTKEQALPGRRERMPGADATARHFVHKNPIVPPFPAGIEQAMFGMGCFWGAEKQFWLTSGVFSTAVGYAAGHTPNPTYEEVCSGMTGHNEVVLVAYDPKRVAFDTLLKVFWEGHDPTEGMRQGNDVGTQYRSGIYCFTKAQLQAARASAEVYGRLLAQSGYGPITTEILDAPEFF